MAVASSVGGVVQGHRTSAQGSSAQGSSAEVLQLISGGRQDGRLVMVASQRSGNPLGPLFWQILSHRPVATILTSFW